ncbi:MAG: Na(+)/H(+) antiporter [uncultured Sulfurovum sp.]|uniref:Na(+)/H(+) antiporter n=1 Tax=uncultured Sulfurovum sp. TaxID=269237 RepID=A0A6S6S0B1_9BACT|nr:MAG: Na(+)/H(+) antiporter [uncultured Sulfurovum sp.]
MQTLFYIGLIFVLGAFMKWISAKVGLLNVVGYLILGFLIGPSVLGIITHEFIEQTHIITDLSLSLIAVLVGANLKYNLIKEVWGKIVIVSLFETFFTFLFIFISFYVFFDFFSFGLSENNRLLIALLFGGLSAATAPATILAIIHELKAKGKFSSFLLSVVAADNAIALILFSFIVAFTSVMIGDFPCTGSTFFSVLWIIFLSVLLGAVGAIISELIDRIFIDEPSMKTTSTLGMIFIVYSLSEYWGLKPLFSSLVMGIVMANISNEFFLVKEEFDNHLKNIIFLLFFTLSAMHLDVSFLVSMPLVIVVYVLFRILGKVVGVWIGSKVSGCDDKHVQKYLGVALFPQAGIAIGLALSLQNTAGFEMVAPLVLNVIIATTLVHEFIGPLFTKHVLKKSGECDCDGS